MNKVINIRNKTISQEGLFVIAEVGNQFGGSYEKARELVKVASDAGADAVKFIFWYPDEILADKDTMYEYETSEGKKTEPLYDVVDRLRLSPSEWWYVRSLCLDKGILFSSTVNCPSAFDLANDIDTDFFKMSSWDWNFTDLWEWVAKTRKPVVADTGPVNTYEVARGMEIMKRWGNDKVVLLHCFHADQPGQVNMNSIPYMASAFDCLAGYSSADREDYYDAMSIALGGCILEKRLTLDTEGGTLDDARSKNPEEFKRYIETMRSLKEAMGKCDLIPSDADLKARKKWFRRLVADTTILKGQPILSGFMEAKRGETGVSSEHSHFFIGRNAKRDIQKNEDITWGDV